MIEHPEQHLSAYLDDGLTQGEHERVRAHLQDCARCRRQVEELRATSRLIGALPELAPRRSLVPRLGRAPVWLRPVRLLGAMGSGLFVFLFIASAVLHTGSSLGGGTTTAERLAEKGQFGAAANALASDAAARAAATAVPAAAPAAEGAAQSSAGTTSRDQATGSATPVARADSQGATGEPSSAVDAPPAFGPPPQVFLGLAVLCAIAAFVAHRRLRRT
jgi:anti-sigma factor RsiW